MSEIAIGARIPEYMLSNVAGGLGISAESGKSHAIRYCLYRLAGHSDSDARRMASPPRRNGNMRTAKRNVTSVRVPETLMASVRENMPGEIKAKMPDGIPEAYIIRFAMHKALGYDDDECHAFAYLKPGRPRKQIEHVT